MPNIFSCDPHWLEKLQSEQEKVVVAAWCGGDEKCNRWMEKLAELEAEGIPVFVIDSDSCPAIAEKAGLKPGEVVVFNQGEEKGRVEPGDNLDEDLKRVREITE